MALRALTDALDTALVNGGCPRCHGDVIMRRVRGDAEFSCLQCGCELRLTPVARAVPSPSAIPERTAQVTRLRRAADNF